VQLVPREHQARLRGTAKASEPIDAATYDATIAVFEDVMKLLHPFMPFLTEEVWHHLRERKAGEDIIIAAWPKGGAGDAKLEAEVQHAFDLVTRGAQHPQRARHEPEGSVGTCR
jgi:valyl-tRNA synthetase